MLSAGETNPSGHRTIVYKPPTGSASPKAGRDWSTKHGRRGTAPAPGGRG